MSPMLPSAAHNAPTKQPFRRARSNRSVPRTVSLAPGRRSPAPVATRQQSRHRALSGDGTTTEDLDARSHRRRDLPGVRESWPGRVCLLRRRSSDGLRVSPVPSTRLAGWRLTHPATAKHLGLDIRDQILLHGSTASRIAVDGPPRGDSERSQAGCPRILVSVV